MHAVFSGVYGFKNGVNSYWSSPNFKKNSYKTLPKYLHDLGYATFGDSINKLILPPDGFDELSEGTAPCLRQAQDRPNLTTYEVVRSRFSPHLEGLIERG